MIEYNWKISEMKSLTGEGDFICPVNEVYWRLQAKDGDKLVEKTGVATFDVSNLNTSTFIPLDQLNKETVIGWVTDQLGETTVSQFKQELAAELSAS